MTYTVLARRYRSRDFDEIVGQEPIARTLQNAIRMNRTAHAYLFCGTRGVGKTSMARIFAKALNVTDELEQAVEICDAILRGDDLDVIEIDGASNRGVQQARELIAAAGLSPSRCPYRIYIIDEVHMLSKDAFNTLLKTMEEPPSHVKFILCTTEPKSVPPTIQSRCQRFDFRPLPTALIAEQLRAILEQEQLEADAEVIHEVARLGNGSMRDALTLLDRLLAAGETRLTASLLEQMLGLPDQALIVALVDAVIAADAAEALRGGGALLATGASVEQALELLTEHLRSLLIVAACGADSDLVELSEEARETAGRQAAAFDAAGLVHLLALCDSVARSARDSSTARALFDAVVARMALSRNIADVAAILEGAPPAGKKKAAAPPLKPSPAPVESPPAPPAPPKTVTEVKRSAAPPAPAAAEPAAPTVSDDEVWPTVLAFAARSHSDQARIEHLCFRSFDGRTLHLAVDEHGADLARFLKSQIPRIADLVTRATGRRVVIELEAAARPANPAPSTREIEQVASLPEVSRAAELFDATVIDVQDLPKGEEGA